jgi:hypothetical protein
LLYGDATGTVSSRKRAKAPSESIPFRFIAGGLHPAHDTLAHCRKTLLSARKHLCVHILLSTQEVGVLTWGPMSLDGTTIPADAATNSAISDKRLLARESPRRTEVDKLCDLTEHAEGPEGLVLTDASALRHERLANLAKAKVVLEARAQERYEAAQAAYEAHRAEREATTRHTGRTPRGRPPTPPTLGARDKDPSNCTDPESRLMKNSPNEGFEQQYNAQAAVAQDSFLIVANTLSNHPNDHAEAIPTLDAIPAALGQPQASALDHGYVSANTIAAMEARHIDPSIATGREPHQASWWSSCAQQPMPPPADASPQVPMAYTLHTESGRALSRLHTCPGEPVLGIIKDLVGFRQCSRRGLQAAAGEWCLVWTACNLKRRHTLSVGSVRLLHDRSDGSKAYAQALRCPTTRRASRTRLLWGTSRFLRAHGRLKTSLKALWFATNIFSPTGS